MKWFLLLIADILFGIIARLLTPVLPLFAIGKDHLPKWLSWFDTPDSPIYGDAGFRAENKDSYWTRVKWLE